MNSMILLDESGDTTIVWDEDTEAALIPIIQKKMDAGIIFYIIKPRALALLPPKKVRAKKIAEIKKAGAVVINDADLSALFEKGDVVPVKSGDGDIVTVKKSNSASEVAKSNTVAIRPARGG